LPSCGINGDQRLAGAEPFTVGPGRPLRHLILGDAELAQPVQYFEILHRVGIAGERHGKGADLGAAQRILRQQRRFGIGLVQPFDDRERLGEHGSGIVFERRHQALWVDGEIGRRALLALAQVMREVLGPHPLEIERDPDPVGRGTAEIAVQLHRNLPVNSWFAWVSCH
jgi:hypothetical protein